jgi:hypothetical protein
MWTPVANHPATAAGENYMKIPSTGWSNKKSKIERHCQCGSWKQHWINETEKPWPATCSILGCSNKPTVGAHITHTAIKGEKIVPMCDSCSAAIGTFTLKGGVTVPSGNKTITCEKKKIDRKITEHYSSARQDQEQIEKISKNITEAFDRQPDNKK